MSGLDTEIPRILITAPKSGSGKTLITCGMIEIFRRRGMEPSAFKCGPDYIDPMFHRYVSGVPGANLDSFFLEAEAVRQLLVDTVQRAGSRSAVIEGVMGYFDGLSGTELQASSYDIARITGTPAILVVDAKGASRSLVPLIAGFVNYPFANDGRKKSSSGIAGVILNRTSPMMAGVLRKMIENECGVPVLGCLPESEEWKMESRHLGLFLPEEIADLRQKIARLADQMEKSCDIDAIVELAKAAEAAEVKSKEAVEAKSAESADAESEEVADAESGDVKCTELLDDKSVALGDAKSTNSADVRKEAKTEHSQRTSEDNCGERHGDHRPAPVRIAVAMDAAFCFYYQENRRMMEKAGAELVPFSPLSDQGLPEGISGILLEGGYPELHAKNLAENSAMRSAISAAAHAKMPILAECGGFMYLHEELEGADGVIYPGAAVISGRAYRTPKLGRFGYIDLRNTAGDVKIKGHEYHYWDSTDCGADWTAEKPNGKTWECIHDRNGMVAGFPHLYYPSNPEFVKNWIAECRNWSKTHER